MGIDVVPRRTADRADIRLRLGSTAENDRTLDLNEPSVAEGPAQCLRHEHRRRAVEARLRLLDEQEPVDQLDRVVLVEEAMIQQPLVLVSGPAMQADRR